MSVSKSIFGPIDSWHKLAKDIGASIEGGDIFSKNKVVLKYKKWEIVLDFTDEVGNDPEEFYTIIKTSTSFKLDFKFGINTGIDSSWTALFRLKNPHKLKIGHSLIDKNHKFYSNNKEVFKALFESHEVYYHFFRRTKWGYLAFMDDELIYTEEDAVYDARKLKSIFIIFKRTLDYLDALASQK